MDRRRVLVVDDERNIRLTLSHSLEALDLEVETAVNGEQAIDKIEEKPFDLVLLDLKMPGLDGIKVLKRIKTLRPETKVIIITAYGTIDLAVEAMKLGAVDFLQKPFSPADIRELASQVLDRDKIDEQRPPDYAAYLELARKSISQKNLEKAVEFVRQAIALDPSRPESFNLLGPLAEMRGDHEEAAEHYRTALRLDPSNKPAHQHLERVTRRRDPGGKDRKGRD